MVLLTAALVKALPYVGAGALAYIAANLGGANLSVNRVNDWNYPVKPPPGLVSINVPSFKENPRIVDATFRSLLYQNIVYEYPEKFEFVFAGVRGDPNLDLSMVKQYTNNIVLADKRGKLLGRHLAIKASKGDIIVSVDADSQYGPSWLNLMLQPYAMPDVVATTAPTYSRYAFATYIPKLIYYSGLMLGRGSSFRKIRYLDIGGFDTRWDYEVYTPKALENVWREEELGFHRRLSQLGRIEFVDAPMEHAYDWQNTEAGAISHRGLHRVLQRGRRA